MFHLMPGKKQNNARNLLSFRNLIVGIKHLFLIFRRFVNENPQTLQVNILLNAIEKEML
jgi:hypothetical protein